MTAPTLTADKGEQLTVTFTYGEDLTGRVATFVVRLKPGAADPPLLKLISGVASDDGELTVDAAAKTVTLVANGPATLDLPASATWAMWLDAGQDDASVVSGALRLYEVVQP